MGALSHDQFRDKVNEEGASRNLHTGEEPELTRGMYTVSDPSHEAGPLAHPLVRAQIVEHHEEMMRDPALKGNPLAMQGGWTETNAKTGIKEGYLDSSALEEGRRRAVAVGRANKQLAAFSHSRALDEKQKKEVYMRRQDVPKQTGELAGLKVTGNRTMGYTLDPRRKPYE